MLWSTLGPALAALPDVQALQLYTEHNLDPQVWIDESSPSVDDRVKASGELP
jgi:hypothetical protein